MSSEADDFEEFTDLIVHAIHDFPELVPEGFEGLARASWSGNIIIIIIIIKNSFG